jgi:hypothetical protein
MAEHRDLAEAAMEKPVSRIAAAVIIAIWLVSLGVIALLVSRRLQG